MHKPLFFLVNSNTSFDAKDQADSKLSEMDESVIDWYQGIKESHCFGKTLVIVDK